MTCRLSYRLRRVTILMIAVLGASLLTACTSCGPAGSDISESPSPCAVGTAEVGGQPVNVKTYSIHALGWDDLPQGLTCAVMPVEQMHEIEGLPLADIQGRTGYHPVRISWLLMRLLSSYLTTDDVAYLETASLLSGEFLGTAIEWEGALYFPYTFDFNLHGLEDELMEAPWYSGMAQGIALSAYVRFYYLTEDEAYLEVCRKIFKSFTNLKNGVDGPWVAYVDADKYYWIEEYPIEPPANTLNGFIFAIFGLYEYYLLVRGAETEAVLRAAITTVEHYIPRFRREGHISLYCLKHEVRSAKYHRVHIGQLNSLYSITGDALFLDAARGFRRDTVAVLLSFGPEWPDTVLSLLPAEVALRIRWLYQRYQQIRQTCTPSVESMARSPREDHRHFLGGRNPVLCE